MNRSKLPYIIFGLVAILMMLAIAILLMNPKKVRAEGASFPTQIQKNTDESNSPKISDPSKGKNLEILGAGATMADPQELVSAFAKALASGDSLSLSKLIGKEAVSEETLKKLNQLVKTSGIKVLSTREVGELKMNESCRWEIKLEVPSAPKSERIQLDMLRQENKRWGISKVSLTGQGEADGKDSLSIADAFVQTVLALNFEKAKSYVSENAISDAKIAGLCIIFEEGQYQVRKDKAIRPIFSRGDSTAYLVNLDAVDGKAAQFGLNMKSEESGWKVREINLDALLADYTQRVAGGDVYYSPLVKNPAGGDTLALYFDFDQSEMSPRTRRQLEIVGMILRADSNKKIHLSGHADALGKDNYNHDLSANRAETVKAFLAKSGVAANQIVTEAKGASQPRRPNLTETGADNPSGRRVNRRTEIYLDF